MNYKVKILLFLICIFCIPLENSISLQNNIIVSYDDILNEPVKNIDPDKPMVAITFDDGPTRKYTTSILDTLKKHNAHATFFVLGSRVEIAKDLLERMVLEGNEIGNHTYSHSQLTLCDDIKIQKEIDKTQKEIYNVIRRYPNILRPPYGEYNETLLNHLGEMRLVKWSVDSEDWKSKNPTRIVEKVLHDVKDRDIILLHDLYITTAQAVELLVPALQEEGYQLVTVSDLYTFE